MKKAIAVLVLFSTMIFAQQKGTFTDSRDNKTYEAVKIGSQIWMAENLNYATSGSKCYENNSGYCAKYGRLYDWNTAMKACPSGWHLPSDYEWFVLMDAVYGGETAGKKLKAKSGWYGNGNGTDDYGFSALPGGYSDLAGSFVYVGTYGSWWSATEDNTSEAYYRLMTYDLAFVGRGAYYKSLLYSVRCVQGSLTYEQPTYNQPTYEQPKNKTSYSSSSESIDFSKYIEIGWQYIWDMDHIRWSYSWFYNTIGFEDDWYEGSSELELIVGGIYRWGIIKPITIGFGLFGGLGARRTDYDEKTDINIRHELGIELILGVISLYIAERNFYRIGGGIGLIF